MATFNLKVSIPQAVSTIAIFINFIYKHLGVSFNTASGKHYCNNFIKANFCLLI